MGERTSILIRADAVSLAEIVWSKPNSLPESVTDRVRRSHEQWFHFTLEPRYFSAIDEIREAHLTTCGITPDEARNDPRYAASSHRNIEVRDGTAPNKRGTTRVAAVSVCIRLGA